MQIMLGVDFFFFKSHDLHVVAHEDQSQSADKNWASLCEPQFSPGQRLLF